MLCCWSLLPWSLLHPNRLALPLAWSSQSLQLATLSHLIYSSPFWGTAPKYVTNSCADPNTRLQKTNWEDCRLQSSSVHPHNEDQEYFWLQSPMVPIHNNFFKRKRWTRSRTLSPVKNFVSGHNFLERVCSILVQLVYHFMALKKILLYVWSLEKRRPKNRFKDPKKIRVEFWNS